MDFVRKAVHICVNWKNDKRDNASKRIKQKLLLVFIASDAAHRADEVAGYVDMFGRYPIGRIKDVDIHFLHYENEEEAYEKWNKRKDRMDWSRIIVKMSQQNLWSDEIARKFDELPLPNKLFFETKKFYLSNTTEVLFRRDKGLPNTREEGERYRRYINILKYINASENTLEYFE